MVSSSVLPVSLAAIVRDEMMNPAGGIVDFVDSTVPFVEDAVIVDTGSVDGTREALEKLTMKYPHLRVLDTIFKDYAHARNESLKPIDEGRKVLVLDADERLTKEDFRIVKRELQQTSSDFYTFDILNIMPTRVSSAPYWDRRLFTKLPTTIFSNFNFRWGENLGNGTWAYSGTFIGVAIKHFLADQQAMERKKEDWYWKIVGAISGSQIPSPSSIPSFREWKAYNPQREKYR